MRLHISIPKGVEFRLIGDLVFVSSSLGILTSRVICKEERGGVCVTNRVSATVLRKMFKGVINGFKEKIKINGVGYKAKVEGGDIKLMVGYKDVKVVKGCSGVKMSVEGNRIECRGSLQEELSQFITKIEEIRPARKDKYKGKGLKRC